MEEKHTISTLYVVDGNNNIKYSIDLKSALVNGLDDKLKTNESAIDNLEETLTWEIK